MFEEFSFGNFRSFKDIQTLNMTSAKITSSNPVLDKENIIPIEGDVSLLKSKAIYGANASGKSNVIKALGTFIKIIRNSMKEENVLLMIDSFQLSTDTVKQPTFFQLVFRIENIRYRYGFEADDKSLKSEWLFATPNKRELPLFIRENDKIIKIDNKHFNEGFLYQKLFENSEEQIFRDNSLFLSHLASTGFGKLSKKIINTITSITIISGLGHQGMYNIAGDFLTDPTKKKFIVELLKKADIGIGDLEIVEIFKEDLQPNIEDENEPKRKIIVSSRPLYDKDFTKQGTAKFSFGTQESEGSKKMFELSPFIYNSLKEGTTLVIDEFDSRFHPLLTKKIIELYNSNQNKNAQLIFTTHDTNLLSAELLRKDQIDFVEKDKYGASHLYTLVEIKGIRNNASFEKDYIQGKYGAIPFLGNFSNLLNAE